MRRYWTVLHIEEEKAVVMFFPSEGSTPYLVHSFLFFWIFIEVEPKSTCVWISIRGDQVESYESIQVPRVRC